jgi:hypothetical protein
MKLFILFLLCLLFFHCQSLFKKKPLQLGFGKASLLPAAIYDDPLRPENKGAYIYKKEEKFGISDRKAGYWRPGSGGKRKLADTLFVTAIYGEDKNGPFAIIPIDVGSFSFKGIDKLQAAIQQAHNIPSNRIVTLSSHTHSAPRWEEKAFMQCIVTAVGQAMENVRPVQLASLFKKIDGKKYIINRRVHVKGLGTRMVMFNTDVKVHEDHLEVTEHLKKWIRNIGADPKKFLKKGKKYTTYGPVDNTLRALFFRDAETKKLLGSFVPFAAHSCIVSAKVANGDVSPDFPGYIKQRLEEKLGGVAMFGQGASGNQRPLNKEYSHAFAKKYGHAIADLIIEGYPGLRWAPLTEMAFHDQPVSVDIHKDIYLTPEQVQARKDSVERLFDKTTNPMQRRELQNAYWYLYRMKRVKSRIRETWHKAGKADCRLCAVQFNEAVLLMSKGELFHELGRAMTAPFKDRQVMLATLANEYISYFPMKEDYARGGYEPSVSLVVPGAEQNLVKGAHTLLNRIYAK